MRIIANVTTDTNGFDFMVARLAFSLVVDGYGLPPPPRPSTHTILHMGLSLSVHGIGTNTNAHVALVV